MFPSATFLSASGRPAIIISSLLSTAQKHQTLGSWRFYDEAVNAAQATPPPLCHMLPTRRLCYNHSENLNKHLHTETVTNYIHSVRLYRPKHPIKSLYNGCILFIIFAHIGPVVEAVHLCSVRRSVFNIILIITGVKSFTVLHMFFHPAL